MQPCLFFDRDGIVNTRLVGEYVRSVAEFSFIPEFLQLFELSLASPLKRIVITNQQGVGKGLMSQADLDEIHSYMQSELKRRFGCAFDGIYSCTDLATSASSRRKPEPGMILEAAAEHQVQLSASWMIGDSVSDVQAGRRAGTRTMLVGHYTECLEADLIVPNLSHALHYFRNNGFPSL